MVNRCYLLTMTRMGCIMDSKTYIVNKNYESEKNEVMGFSSMFMQAIWNSEGTPIRNCFLLGTTGASSIFPPYLSKCEVSKNTDSGLLSCQQFSA